MRKQRIEYDSQLDALVAVAKRLSVKESQYQLGSEAFFDEYCKGVLEDSIDFIEWANDYQHYLAIRKDLSEQLRHVA